MTLSEADVRKVAALARIDLSDEAAQRLASQLGDVLQYIEQLSEVEVGDVEPMAHAIEQVNVLADDVEEPSHPRDVMLKNAPRRDDECYRVPPVLGE